MARKNFEGPLAIIAAAQIPPLNHLWPPFESPMALLPPVLPPDVSLVGTSFPPASCPPDLPASVFPWRTVLFASQPVRKQVTPKAARAKHRAAIGLARRAVILVDMGTS